MSQLIESIKLLDGNFENLNYHEQRMRHSLELVCGVQEKFHLQQFLSGFNKPASGLYKCKIIYDKNIKEVEFHPYEPKAIRKLKIVEHNSISYTFKFTDRTLIDELFLKRNTNDDILIVKNGLVTDSSYSNIVFKKDHRWYTPSSALLKGTMRQKLLDLNRITEDEIRVEDISSFESFKLINAMLGFEGPEIDVTNIVS